jgi:hypothetical protein
MRMLFLFPFLMACGGAVEDGGSSPSPTTTTATNAPTSTNTGDGCARACERMTITCAALDDPRCDDTCGSMFNSSEEKAAYASCIDALSCDDIKRGVSMNYGPLGECATRAQRH